jgi:hypothetical protein
VPAGVVVNKDDTEFTEEEKQRIEQALAETQQKNQVFLVVRISIPTKSRYSNFCNFNISELLKYQKLKILIPFYNACYFCSYSLLFLQACCALANLQKVN